MVADERISEVILALRQVNALIRHAKQCCRQAGAGAVSLDNADALVFSIIATLETTRPAPKADSALVGELAYHAETLQKVKDVLANGAHFADDPECHPLYPNYVVAVGAVLAALSDRDVVLEEIAGALERQDGEPISGNETARLHYWRDKAIDAARKIRALKGGVDE